MKSDRPFSLGTLDLIEAFKRTDQSRQFSVDLALKTLQVLAQIIGSSVAQRPALNLKGPTPKLAARKGSQMPGKLLHSIEGDDCKARATK